jgi:hypothetical protein
MPGPLFIDAARSLRDTIREISWTDTELDSTTFTHLAAQILSSTASKLTVACADTASTFLEAYTGSNLRLETIALVYSLAARTDLLGRKFDAQSEDEFVPSLLRSSALCISLAREIAPEANDVMIWASYENFRLHLSFYGETRKLTLSAPHIVS